jgi:hypothetical protein
MSLGPAQDVQHASKTLSSFGVLPCVHTAELHCTGLHKYVTSQQMTVAVQSTVLCLLLNVLPMQK